MSASTRDALSAVDALSPVDGRYRAATEPLRGLLSEAGLIRERIRIEAQWLLHLSASVPQLAGASLSPEVVGSRTSARKRAGHRCRRRGESHRSAHQPRPSRLLSITFASSCPPLALPRRCSSSCTFGCTSEDINNLSYARILHAARAKLLETFEARVNDIGALAHRYADTAMLARTHGQPASPTTLGKNSRT